MNSIDHDRVLQDKKTNRSLVKAEIIRMLAELVAGKIDMAHAAIESVKASRDSDTKSSAGDKYETGRAMMQQEFEHHAAQLNKALQQQSELLKLDVNTVHNKVTVGSLVITSRGNYFISVALGTLNIGKENYHTISLAAPIGQLLLGKKAGEEVNFLGNQMTILEIY